MKRVMVWFHLIGAVCMAILAVHQFTDPSEGTLGRRIGASLFSLLVAILFFGRFWYSRQTNNAGRRDA